MYHFNSKQKVIFAIFITIVVGYICYFVYVKKDNPNQTTLELENNLTMEREDTEEETYGDDTILVHVSGAVHQEGIVELKVGSRIADAIEKARRNKRRGFYRRC